MPDCSDNLFKFLRGEFNLFVDHCEVLFHFVGASGMPDRMLFLNFVLFLRSIVLLFLLCLLAVSGQRRTLLCRTSELFDQPDPVLFFQVRQVIVPQMLETVLQETVCPDKCFMVKGPQVVLRIMRKR